jgi:hypothetical protein
MTKKNYQHIYQQPQCCKKASIDLVCKKHDSSCGSECIFIENNSVKKLTIKQLIYAQSRIMKWLYNNGFRMKPFQSFSALNIQIKKSIHEACQPERLNEEMFFSVINFIEKDNAKV